ncbi:MAG: PH domain-containing protein [Acidimicrobiia bacterium]
MPFRKRDLLQGEVVALDVRPHWWYFAKPLFVGVPVLLILVVALKQNGDVQTAGLWLAAALALAWAAWLGVRLLKWQTTRYIVTNQRLVFREGILRKEARDIPLDKVDDVKSDQGVFARLIGAGDLQIDTDEGRLQTFLPAIPNPHVFRQEILRQRVGSKAPQGQSIPDLINALADLRDRGEISQEQYEAKKAQLLDRL